MEFLCQSITGWTKRTKNHCKRLYQYQCVSNISKTSLYKTSKYIFDYINTHKCVLLYFHPHVRQPWLPNSGPGYAWQQQCLPPSVTAGQWLDWHTLYSLHSSSPESLIQYQERPGYLLTWCLATRAVNSIFHSARRREKAANRDFSLLKAPTSILNRHLNMVSRHEIRSFVRKVLRIYDNQTVIGVL